MKKEAKIRKIAKIIYMKSQNSGLENNPTRDWKEAESLYNNKFKYFFWNTEQFLFNYHYHILAIAAITSILMASWSIMVSRTATDLNMRPYVSVDIEIPRSLVTKDDTFYGNNIALKNSGKTPASNISTQYYITTDKDQQNMHGLEWFKNNLGGFGATAFIIPNATEIEPGLRSLSPSAEYYYFEAVTCYEGLKRHKLYWTHIKKAFYIDRNTNNFYPVWIYGEWDRNKDFMPPVLSRKEEVAALLDKIKRNRK